MTIFARRVTQRAVNELAQLVPPKKLHRKVKDLNRYVRDANHVQVVAHEWEFIMVAAFAKYGHVAYERALGSPNGPIIDIHFSDTVAGEKLEFLADVRTVSDSDAISKNSVEEFLQEILATAMTLGIVGGIFLRVDSEIVGHTGKQKVRLLLPIATSLSDYVTHNIRPWLQEIAGQPTKKSTFRNSDSQAQFTLCYDPAEKPIATGEWLSFETPYSLNRNPLYNALQHKAIQLRDTGWTGLSGIIICDGGCAALAENRISGVRCSEIVNRFLEIHPEFAFVDVLRIEENRHSLGAHGLSVVSRTFWNMHSTRTERAPVLRLLEDVHASLPRPRYSPRNLRSIGDTRNIFSQGMSVSKNSIKISARALAELLANRLDAESFHKNLPSLASYVKRALEDGKLIRSVNMEHSHDTDEDWIVFTFAEDVAIAPFNVPG